MVKVVKDRRHTNAELEQSDDINDNASEAGSYTSASTALLSTESAGEHNELGGINYEEGVHQQTINEDEEVENDYKNQQKQHVTEAIKSSEKSIISNGNDGPSKNPIMKDTTEVEVMDKILFENDNGSSNNLAGSTSDVEIGLDKALSRSESDSFPKDETVVRPMSSLQEQASLDVPDGDVIVYNRMQREESRESSAQSESVIFGNSDEDRIVSNEAEITRTQLSRHYTIAGDDPQSIFRSVTIVDAVQFIENEDVDLGTELNSGNSFCLDAETSENIRKKIMAYSLSEADSDYYDPSKIAADDFHIDTAMTDAMDTSTETESTIVSAAAKIQAGARGFLTRRRLRRASAGTKSSTQETKASFGNDAISESLERFIEEEAAKKIQAAYRLHSKKQKKQKQKNAIKSASLESSLAAKRQTLQRGDALQKDSNSTPDDENIESKIVDTIAVQQNDTVPPSECYGH
ncbi:GH19564 [Drosophila grimshawi]|uniref:GH19564 n=1 Tax=Drosophila grimshawi TaxID=7222 RepID=B4JHM2_DROGR|nr:GH19564 [Drosophila grimshawi]